MERPPAQAEMPPDSPVDDRLDSWKEIAVYLKRGVRAVQRWEKEEGLPIHRHVHKKLDSVYAYKHELDAWLSSRHDARKSARKDEAAAPSIAVLPFVNLGPGKEYEYFSDGLTEELISALAKIEGLRVVSRTSVFRLKGKAHNIRDVGEQLNARFVLEGSVRTSGKRVRVTVQLIDSAEDYHLWSETYDRELKDVFSIQDEISRSIAANLKLKLLDASAGVVAARHTADFDAYDLYLKGRHYWNLRTGEGLKKCIECFQKAIERDPQYALPYAGLADSYNMLGYYSFLPPAEALPKAKAAASGALQRDETLAEAHAALAFSQMFYDWDFNAAEKEFKRALELQPDYAVACYWYGLNLAALGRPYEAVEHVRRAQELDPLSPIINTYVAGAYYFARRYDQAIQKCRETLELGSDFAPARLVLGWAYRQKSMFQEALVEFRKAKRSSSASADALAAIGHTFGVWARRREAKAALEDLKKMSKKSYVSSGHFAMVHLGLGDKDAAFDWLDKACAERYAWLVFLKVDPVFECLSSDPRFATLAGKIGLV